MASPAVRALRHLWLYAAIAGAGIPVGLLVLSLLADHGGRGFAGIAGAALGLPLAGAILLLIFVRKAHRLEVLRSVMPDAIVIPVLMQQQDWVRLRTTPSRPRHWFPALTIATFDDFGMTVWEGSGTPRPTCEIPWGAVQSIGSSGVNGDDGSQSEHAIHLTLDGTKAHQSVRFALLREHARFGLKLGLPYPTDQLRERLRERWQSAVSLPSDACPRWQRWDLPARTAPRRRSRPGARLVGRWHGPPFLRSVWSLSATVLGAMWIALGILFVVLSDGWWQWLFAVLLSIIVMWQATLLALLLATRWTVREGELVLRRAGGWYRVPLASIARIEITTTPSLAAGLWLGSIYRVWYGLEARLRDGSRVPLPELFGSARRSIEIADGLESLLPHGVPQEERPPVGDSRAAV